MLQPRLQYPCLLQNVSLLLSSHLTFPYLRSCSEHLSLSLSLTLGQLIQRTTTLRINLIQPIHTRTQMIINMTNDLPYPRRSSVHLERHHIPIIQTLRGQVTPVEFEAVPVHVEDVRCATKSVDVPDYIVVGTHYGYVSGDLSCKKGSKRNEHAIVHAETYYRRKDYWRARSHSE